MCVGNEEKVCVCVFVKRVGRKYVSVCVGNEGKVLTSGVFSDAVVFAIPVPEQQGGVPGARQHVAVAADVRLGARQTRHHVPMAKHDLRKFPCQTHKQSLGLVHVGT